MPADKAEGFFWKRVRDRLQVSPLTLNEFKQNN